MGRTKRYTNEQFIESIKTSFSIAQDLKKIGLKSTGANYKCFKLRAKKLNVDMSHFTGKANLKGQKNNRTKNITL